MESLSTRIREARKSASLTQDQLATACGVTRAAVSLWESSRPDARTKPKYHHLKTISEKTRQPLRWFLETGEVEDASASTPWPDAKSVRGITPQDVEEGLQLDAATIPVASVRLAAGQGGFEIQVDPEALSGAQFYSKAWIRSRRLKADRLLRIEVRGASMEPLLHDGDYVTINLDSRKPKQNKVYAVMLDGQPVIKRLVKRAGTWWICSDNTSYSRHDCEMKEEEQVIGEAVDRTSTFF